MMKTILTAAAMLTCLAAGAQKEPAAVYLVAGQSNTDGRALNSQLPEDIAREGYKHCLWSYGSGANSTGRGAFIPFSPRIFHPKRPDRFAYDAIVCHKLEKKLGRTFYVVKESKGGTAIDPRCRSNGNMHWSADKAYLDSTASAADGGGSLLKAFTENIGMCIDNKLAGLPEGYDIKCMMWHQGESDRAQADAYYENLKAVVAYVRQYLVGKTGNRKYAKLPFLCGGKNPQSRQYNKKIEEAERRLAAEDPDFHIISGEGAQLSGDGIHFDAAGTETMGKRMFEKIEQLGLF